MSALVLIKDSDPPSKSVRLRKLTATEKDSRLREMFASVDFYEYIPEEKEPEKS